MNKSSSPTSLSLVQGVSSIYQPPQILERALLLSQSFDFLLTLCTSFLFFESLSSSWLLSSADLWVIPPILWKFSIWPMVLLLLLSRFSHVRLCATPWTAAYQASPSMGFSRQAYWSGVPLPSLYSLSLLQVLVLSWIILTSSHIIQLHNSIIIFEHLSFSYLQLSASVTPSQCTSLSPQGSLFGLFQRTLPPSFFLFLSVSHALADNISSTTKKGKDPWGLRVLPIYQFFSDFHSLKPMVHHQNFPS